MYYVYILRCADNSYYVGSTEDISKRLKFHNSGKGADFTAKRRPSVIVWLEIFKNKKQALRKELEIKKFSRAKKENKIFSVGTIWKHYKGITYIILGHLEDLIVYSQKDVWTKFSKNKNQKGEQAQVSIRSRNQWLDWIDKDKKILRFNLFLGSVAQW